MIDDLSLAASIIAIVQITGDVINYIETVKSASATRKKVLEELQIVHSLLYRLRDRAEAPCLDKTAINSLEWLTIANGPIDQFKTTLERLFEKLKPAKGPGKLLNPVLIWPLFQKEEVNEILDSIERQKSFFNLALQHDIL